jgi:16S rRNA (guanine1207-N2)-methyltransferase
MNPQDHYFSSDPQSPYEQKRISAIIRNQAFEFFSAEGVFSANKVDTGTLVLLKRLEIPKNGRILDLGCGIGIIGVVVGVNQPNLEVHFIDINARATQLARTNAKKYNLEYYSIFTGDCMDILEKNSLLYDAIYFNPPIRLGKKVYYNHILQAIQYLKPNGCIQIVIKKKLGAESAYSYLETNVEDSVFEMSILGKNSGYWVFEIRKTRT